MLIKKLKLYGPSFWLLKYQKIFASSIYHRKLKTVAYLYQQNGSPFKGKNKGKKKIPKNKK